MNDPHVAELRYRLLTGTEVAYRAGSIISWSTPECDGELTDGLLTLKMKTHHSTIGSAQDSVREFLNAWKIKTALDQGRGYLDFEFDLPEVIDRNPSPPGGPRVLEAGVGTFMVIGGTVAFHHLKASYPPPPTDFSVSPIVQTLWQRFRAYLNGKEPLTGMGYFCLTVIESDAGGRSQAAEKYTVHIEVLRNLGRLTSQVGDKASARKFSANISVRPHTPPEEEWIKATIKKLIQRAGELASSPSEVHSLIQMSDLPTI